MDLSEFRAFFKEHWKPILIVTLTIVCIIVAVSLTLFFVLRRPPDQNPSVSPFNGPIDINGDTAQNSGRFAYPQIINNPDFANINLFGELLFVHEAGYICCVGEKVVNDSILTTPVLFFYYTNLQGQLQGPQRIDLDFIPTGYVVCNGMFAPIFNVVNEVYYLFISVGMPVSNHQSPSVVSKYATNVILFALNTAVTSTNWERVDINAKFTQTLQGPGGKIQAMSIPTTSFTWNSAQPYIGTFGDKIQVVLDDNSPILKQSLYISGSEYDTTRPGGNLYWFLLQDNNTSPSILMLYTIQDAKLLLMQNQGYTISRSPSDYTNGFASDFYVTSGNGSKNILVVANCTGQDNISLAGTAQPAAPCGYVQGYILDTSGNLSWIQPQASAVGQFLYRYIGTPTDPSIFNQNCNNNNGITACSAGFARSVTVINDCVVIGQSSPDPQGYCVFQVYQWSATPYDSGKQCLTLWGSLNPSVEASDLFPQTPFSPFPNNIPNSITLRFNSNLQTIDDGSNQLIATSWYTGSPSNLISTQTPLSKDAPLKTFTTIQALGSNFDSVITSAAPDRAQIYMSRLGFAQCTQNWLSRSGLTVRLAFNDPYSPTFGRFIVLTRNRSGIIG